MYKCMYNNSADVLLECWQCYQNAVAMIVNLCLRHHFLYFQLLTLLLMRDLTELQLCDDVALTELLTLPNDTNMADVERVLCGVDVKELLEELNIGALVSAAQICVSAPVQD